MLVGVRRPKGWSIPGPSCACPVMQSLLPTRLKKSTFHTMRKPKSWQRLLKTHFFLASCILIQQCCLLCKIILGVYIIMVHSTWKALSVRPSCTGGAVPLRTVIILKPDRTRGNRMAGAQAARRSRRLRVASKAAAGVQLQSTVSFLTPRPAAAHLQ